MHQQATQRMAPVAIALPAPEAVLQNNFSGDVLPGEGLQSGLGGPGSGQLVRPGGPRLGGQAEGSAQKNQFKSIFPLLVLSNFS